MTRHVPNLSSLTAALLLAVAIPAGAAPCATASAECTEWVGVNDGVGRTLLYRTYPLEAKNPEITRALVMVHGAGRDADNYFRHVLAAAFLAGALENTIIISPRFAASNGTCRDTLAERELNWECDGAARWTAGGHATGNGKVTSFDIADEILRKLARKDTFPNLRAIVVAGHSAGGQFVSRYVLANQIHERLGTSVTYVIANPSSYAYLDRVRPSASALPANVAAAAPGYVVPLPDKPPPPFAPFSDAENCTTYDNWPYGLANRTGYATRLQDDQLRKQIASRPVTYLLGGLDILPLFGFDGSCGGMAQGPTRLARGLAYAKYLNEKFGAKHVTITIPACGHNARCMVGDDAALAVMFPK